MGVTEKMKGVLRKNGYNEEVISKMTYEDASKLIGDIMAKVQDKKNKTLEEEAKPKVSTNGHTAMYVSYVKDLIVAGKEPAEAIKIIKAVKMEFE